jgi:hypothetical protein
VKQLRVWAFPCAALAVIFVLSGCSNDKAADAPLFEVLGQPFAVEAPKGFCLAKGLTAQGFDQLASQNADKVLLANFVKCSENDSRTPARTYFTILTQRDPNRIKVSRAALFAEEVPDIAPDAFAKLLDRNANFAAVKKTPVKNQKDAFGAEGNLMPRTRDDLCVYGGGRYRRTNSAGSEDFRSVVTCGASIKDRRISVFYHADGPNDLMDMARTVRSLARSIRPIAPE